jgi:hypothetical protein
MSMAWTPQAAPSVESEQAKVRRTDWDEAQSWCNFVLMRPAVFPDDLALERKEIRAEAPPGRAANVDKSSRPDWTQSNRAVHRCELIGRERRLRIKQFLYDYAPPAFDHPCLWESSNIRAFPVGDYLGWLGTDFRKLPAATVSFDRTTIELSVIAGTFSDQELEAICRGLSPAVPKVHDQILRTSFADLCYQSRYREPPIAVPVGYWAHKRAESHKITVLRAQDVPADDPCFRVSPPKDYGYLLNTAFVFDNQGRLQEVDLVFEHAKDSGRYMRLLISPSDAAKGLPYPPVREQRQPCSSRVLRVKDHDVHHAYLDERYGQHEAVWQKDGLNIMLIVKPATWTNMAWFDNLLERMI